MLEDYTHEELRGLVGREVHDVEGAMVGYVDLASWTTRPAAPNGPVSGAASRAGTAISSRCGALRTKGPTFGFRGRRTRYTAPRPTTRATTGRSSTMSRTSASMPRRRRPRTGTMASSGPSPPLRGGGLGSASGSTRSAQSASSVRRNRRRGASLHGPLRTPGRQAPAT